MLILHISDLHLSRYGESGTWTRREERDNDHWDTVHTWQRWLIEGVKDRKGRPERLRLVDPSGVIHRQRSWPKRDDQAISGLLSMAMERHMTSAENLVLERPTPEDLVSLLRVDRRNTNLLFLRLLDEITRIGPDVVVLTGDVTDNGFGYGLVEHYLKPWIQRKRLFVVPGNHDTYDMFPRKGRRARATAKEEQYRAFAKRVGMVCNKFDAWLHYVDDVVLVGLSSCKPPLTPLSASGEVESRQLSWMQGLSRDTDFSKARFRLGLVHHHLLRMPLELGRRSPIEVGMRLRNAPQVMGACRDVRLDMLFNGHRHHGYAVELPGHPMVISSPSSTLGCKSTEMEYVWLVDLSNKHPRPALHRLREVTPDTDQVATKPRPSTPTRQIRKVRA